MEEAEAWTWTVKDGRWLLWFSAASPFHATVRYYDSLTRHRSVM